MTQFVKVGSRTEFEDLEGGKLVEAGGHRVAVFNVGGSYYAIESACPHRGGPLPREWWPVKRSSALGTVPDSM